MMVLITYDVSIESPGGKKRLRHISKACLDYGVRVQYSVFECELEPAQWSALKAKLLDIFNEETDSLRFYMLGKRWRNKVEHFGAKKSLDVFKDSLIL
jgi:CRISPR-associated protein Cas2